MSAIEEMLTVARDVQPDLWKRTDAIARIIDPGAFMDDYICHPADSDRLLRARLKCQQAAALSKAQEILKYLGVNTETDWYDILTRLSGPAQDRTP